MIQTQFHTNIQVLKTNYACEYFETSLGKYFTDHGIIHQSSCAHTPQQNGITERKNRHILEVAHSIMFTTHIPKFLWGETILTATYLINQMSSCILNFPSPYKLLSQTFPESYILNSLPLKVFGCLYMFIFTHIFEGNLIYGL